MFNYKLVLEANEMMIELALAGDKTAKLSDLMTARAMIKDCYIADLEAEVEELQYQIESAKVTKVSRVG